VGIKTRRNALSSPVPRVLWRWRKSHCDDHYKLVQTTIFKRLGIGPALKSIDGEIKFLSLAADNSAAEAVLRSRRKARGTQMPCFAQEQRGRGEW